MTTTATSAPLLTSASPNLPPCLYGYAAMHLGMQRDAARLVRTLDSDVADPVAVRRWWTLFQAVIVRHHTREDELIWPALAEADASFADDVASMHDDHDELDTAMQQLDDSLAELAARPDTAPAAAQSARTAAVTFRDVLIDHLAREEAVAFHRLAQHPGLWADIERRIERDIRIGDATFELPWVHDELAQPKADALMRRLPRPFRPVARWLWRPRYERVVAAAHGRTA